jgi:choice-of-anchor B domain-containing protein
MPMKILLLLLSALPFLSAQTAYNSTLIGQLNKYGPNPANSSYSEIWGWTDTVKNREYVFIGTPQGTSVVDITTSPIKEVSFLMGPTSSYNYHEFRTYKNYLYIGAEGTTAARRPGVQIIDLSTLPDSASFKKVYTWTDTTSLAPLTTKKYNRAHTVSVDKHFLYVNGGDFGGTRIMDISDPLNPLQVGSYGKGSTPYVHDSYIRNDTLYAAAINAGRLDIVDMRVKGHYTQDSLKRIVSKTPTVPEGRTHHVWLSDDSRTMFVATESSGGPYAYNLHIYDITNKSNPIQIATWTSSPTKSIHNIFVKGDFVYIAYYTDGFRVLDISDPSVPIEVAFYKTYPGSSGTLPTFAGAWGVYPYFPSGKIAVSDMNTGVYVLDVNEKKGGRIVGIVTEAGSKDELADVTVTVLETGRTYATNFSGGFLYGTAEGAHRVTFSKAGYISRTDTIITNAGKLDTVRIALTPTAAVSVSSLSSQVPAGFSLSQNYPNPFNPSTTIAFTVPAAAHSTLRIYNSVGQCVADLLNEELAPGAYSIKFDAKQLSSGLYFYRFTSGTSTDIKRMTLVQ